MDTDGYSGALKSHFYEGYLDQLERFKNRDTSQDNLIPKENHFGAFTHLEL